MKVCAHYCGTTIMLADHLTEEQAKELMKNIYIIRYADDPDNDDDFIYPDEMFTEEDDLPFSELPEQQEQELDLDELPF